MRTSAIVGIVFAAIVAVPTTAVADSIMGGSDLLSGSDLAQLSTWLGEGSITLTNIFDKAIGDDSTDFHAAVDGAGRTFSIIEVTAIDGNTLSTPVIIGGYNPYSWTSTTGYSTTPAGESRDAFIFNLTTTEYRGQNQAWASGADVAYNGPTHGSTFGAGHDIWVAGNLFQGWSYAYSYGVEDGTVGGTGWGYGIAGYNDGTQQQYTYGQIEVFTVVADNPIPEPTSLVLLGLGVTGLVVVRRRRG